jgi:predicted CXXCH cytochrome family protein
MMGSKCIASVACIVLAVVLICGFGSDRGMGLLPSIEGLGEMAGPPSAEAADEAAFYRTDVEPLTPAECGQCHLPIFEIVKGEGGKHQFECVRCHTQLHRYNPRKNNYDEIMPKCASCHVSASGGAFHGENPALTPCLTCHVDPHKPLAIPMSGVEANCGICHAKESAEIKGHPSKHTTDVSCADCHADKHGFKPECSACHENHSPGVEMATADCMTCHPVHSPTQIVYQKTTPNAICAGCHGDVSDMLEKSQTKHTPVACADCHPSHGEIPQCQRCHGEPHSRAMLIDTTKCGECHGNPHNILK